MVHLNEREYWFWLCNINSIGSITIENLLDYFKEPEAVYNAGEDELRKVPGIGEKRIKQIINSKNPENVRKNLKRVEDMGICFLSFGDEAFPEKLKRIEHPPYAIYVKGKVPDIRFPAVAVVGARECSGYGRDLAEYFSYELSSRGVQIISGMARGVDSSAHYGAICASYATYAVLGCGVDICYPLENYTLFCEIIKRGGLISEYPPGTKPSPGNFPYRNRIISGLSDAILVVEARKKSGSLITANLGLSQGKDILAVPGRVNDILSRGCNDLIKLGAGLVETPEDVLDALKISFPHLCRFFEGKADFGSGNADNGERACSLKRGNKEMLREKAARLKAQDGKIYNILGIEPKHISSIMDESGLSLSQVIESLFELERMGIICVCGQNYYRRVLGENL